MGIRSKHHAHPTDRSHTGEHREARRHNKNTADQTPRRVLPGVSRHTVVVLLSILLGLVALILLTRTATAPAPTSDDLPPCNMAELIRPDGSPNPKAAPCRLK
ncbi:MAG: hypothetical protein N2691_05275 [Patescibacteria group bacterium]|nr:hypothetical protein [Patescibacteria group bacterium]